MIGELVTRFNPGDDVPPWLLVADPVAPGAQFGYMRFHVRADVIDLPDHFLIQPKESGTFPGLLDIAMVGCAVNAATKPVWVALRYEVVLPAEADARRMSGAELVAWTPPAVPAWRPSGEQVVRRHRPGLADRILRRFGLAKLRE